MDLVAFGLFVLVAFVLGQVAVAWISNRFKSSRYWSVPALLLGAVSIVAFADGAAVPPSEGGGPPVIDFGPLLHYLVGLAAAITAVVAFGAGSRAREQYLAQQQTASPELAVATVHDR